MTLDFTHLEISEDLSTGRPSKTTVSIPGQARVIRGDPKAYESLQLRESEAPTLLWSPDVFGQTPDPTPGDTCRFNGKQWEALEVDPWRPDGTLVHARIVVVGA